VQDDRDDRKELEKIHNQLAKAWMTRDRSTIERILAPESMVTHTEGGYRARRKCYATSIPATIACSKDTSTTSRCDYLMALRSSTVAPTRAERTAGIPIPMTLYCVSPACLCGAVSSGRRSLLMPAEWRAEKTSQSNKRIRLKSLRGRARQVTFCGLTRRRGLQKGLSTAKRRKYERKNGRALW
jgi:hypothetical protein